MPIRSFVEPGAFEPEALATMSEAFEAAIKELQDAGTSDVRTKSPPEELLQRQTWVSVTRLDCWAAALAGSKKTDRRALATRTPALRRRASMRSQLHPTHKTNAGRGGAVSANVTAAADFDRFESHLPLSWPGLSRRPRALEHGAGTIEVAGTNPSTTRERWQVVQSDRERL